MYVHPYWLLKCVTFLLCCRCACLEDVLSFLDSDSSCKFQREYFISKFKGTIHILFTKKLGVESILENPCPSPCLSSCPCLSIVGVVRKTSTSVQIHWPNIGSTLNSWSTAVGPALASQLRPNVYFFSSGANDGQTHTSRL